jgi:uracil-DNA glycosylase
VGKPLHMEARPDPDASSLIPSRPTVASLHEAAAGCRACELWEFATQAVFGEGPARAEVMFVGEQPGDAEDLEGRPFVGPAGRLLDRALEAAEIARDDVYVTNAVKHFRWEARGKKRIHRKPGLAHVAACRPWLEGEIEVVHPRVVVCLGATAAQAVIAKDFRVTKHRGEFVDAQIGPLVTATVHPASILRERDDAAREEAFDAFVRDLRMVARAIREPGAAPVRSRPAPG